MVIQPYMTVCDIVSAWNETQEVFIKHNIPVNSKEKLESIVTDNELTILLAELNYFVGSSSETCIEGG